MKSFPWRGSLLATLAIAVVAAFFWARQGDAGLRRRIAELENQRTDLVRLQRDNQDLAAAISRLAAPPPQARLKPSAELAKIYLPPGFVRKADFKNAGTVTAEDAFQTYLWALDRGEPDMLAKTLVFSDAARAEIASSFAGLPPGEQGKYGSPEAMFALLYAYGNGAPMTAMQAVGQTVVSPDQVVLNTNWLFPAGQIREHPIPLYHASTGWKVIVSDLKVEEILQRELKSAP